jgi:hypothetical protein
MINYLIYCKSYADVIKQAAEKENVKLVLLSSTTDSIYLHLSSSSPQRVMHQM